MHRSIRLNHRSGRLKKIVLTRTACLTHSLEYLDLRATPVECVRQPLKSFRGRNHFSNFTSSKWWCHWWWKRKTLAFLPLAWQSPNSASSQVLHPVWNANILCTLPLGFSAVSTTFLAKGRGLGTDTSQRSTPGHNFQQHNNSPEVCVSLASFSPRYTFTLSPCGFIHFQTGLYG